MLANGKASSIVSQWASDINVSLVQSKPRLVLDTSDVLSIKKKKPTYIDTRSKNILQPKGFFSKYRIDLLEDKTFFIFFLKFVGDMLPASSLLFILNWPGLLKMKIID